MTKLILGTDLFKIGKIGFNSTFVLGLMFFMYYAMVGCPELFFSLITLYWLSLLVLFGLIALLYNPSNLSYSDSGSTFLRDHP